MFLKYGFFSILVTVAIITGLYGASKAYEPRSFASREVLLRKIGHELLLCAGDDSSRVMPIQKTGPADYEIYFEHEIQLTHDAITQTVQSVLAQQEKNYSVNILNCELRQSVYSFEIKTTPETSLIPCGGRALPRSCYIIHILFENNTSTAPIWYGLAAVLGLTALGFGFIWVKKHHSPASNVATATMDNSHTLRIGAFLFDSQRHSLQLADTITPLTAKESKLLLLLAASINQLVPRAELQKEIWEKEGVIVTRSLDMFISKLRKKLGADPSIRISNLPGRGYKLEVSA